MNYHIRVLFFVDAVHDRAYKNLEPDVDAAFDQPRVLPDLSSGSAESLIQEVPCIQNRLDPAGKHPECRKVLRYGKAESRIVVFHQTLVRIQP